MSIDKMLQAVDELIKEIIREYRDETHHAMSQEEIDRTLPTFDDVIEDVTEYISQCITQKRTDIHRLLNS